MLVFAFTLLYEGRTGFTGSTPDRWRLAGEIPALWAQMWYAKRDTAAIHGAGQAGRPIATARTGFVGRQVLRHE